MPVILLVRADTDTRAMYADYLRAHAFDVREAENTDEALQIAPEAEVIVTGLRVPGSFSSYELIRRIRQQPATSNRPVVVLTGSTDAAEHRAAQEAGCTTLLLTLCLPDVLLTEVRRLLEGYVA